MSQTKTKSLLETVLNTATGFGVSYILWKWILVPMIDAGYLAHDQSFIITMIFTIASLTRSYIWRRLGNRWLSHEETPCNEITARMLERIR
jgi:hypothetical protein